MISKHRWATRAVIVALTATVFTGVSTGTASAAGSTCSPPNQRPGGPITVLLQPLLGTPGYPSSPLGDAPFAVTGLLDRIVCPLLP